MTTMDLTDFYNAAAPAPQASVAGTLHPIWLNRDEKPLIFFTKKGEEVSTHYRPGQNVQCNGDDCVLCALGQRPQKKLLIPAYQPLFDAIGVLTVNLNRHPQALLPQLAAVIKDGAITMASIAKVDGSRFAVKAEPLQEGEDFGVDTINAYLDIPPEYEEKLSSIYPIVPNHVLAQATDIAKMMALKGITVDMPYPNMQ